MVKNPKFLKNLLTTASALALVGLSATSASAGAPGLRTTTGGVYNYTTGVGMSAPVVAGDSALLNQAANGTTGGARDVRQTNVAAGADGTTLDVTGASNFGSIVNNGGVLNLDITGGFALTLDGKAGLDAVAAPGVANTYSGLKDITLSNAAAQVTFGLNAPIAIDFNGKIENAAAHEGVVEVAAANIITFKDTIGVTNGIKAFTLTGNAAATLERNLKVSGGAGDGVITLGANSVLTVNDNVTITGVAGGAAARITGAAATNGLIKFVKDATVNMENGIGTNAGGTINNRIKAIEIGTGKVTLNTTEILTDEGIKFTQNNNAAEVEFTRALGTELLGDIKNTSGTNEIGTVTVNGGNITVSGSIGETGANGSIKAIKFSTDHRLLIVGNNSKIYAADVSRGAAGAAQGKMAFQGPVQGIYSNLGRDDAPLSLVTIIDDLAAGPATITLTDGKKIYATTVDLAKAAVANILELGQGTLIKGNVDTSNPALGTISIKGDTQITGAIGATNPIGTISFAAAGAGKTLTLDGALVGISGAAVFDFAAVDGNIKLTATGNTAITSTNAGLVVVATGANARGSISSNVAAGNTLTITGKVGDPAAVNALKLLEVKNGGNINLVTDTLHINKINMEGSDGKLTLSGGAAITAKIEEFAHDDGKTTLEIGHNVTFAQGTVLSADATKRLKQVLVLGNKTLNFAKATNLYTVDGIINNGANSGKFIFNDGVSVIDGTIGTDIQKFDTLQVSNADTSVELKKDAFFNGNITIDNKATLIVGGNVLKAASIIGAAPNQGTVKFNNANPMTYTGLLGTLPNKLSIIEVAGNDVTINGAQSITDIKFTNAAQTATYTMVGDLGATNITTTSTTRNHNIKVKANQTILLAANIGTAANSLGNLIIDEAGKTVTIQTANFFAGVTTTQNNQNTVNIDKAGVILRQLGDSTNALELVTFNQSATVNGDTYSKKIDVVETKTATFKGTVSSVDGLELKATAGKAGADAVFEDGSTLVAKIVTTVDKTSTARFNGKAVITKDIGASGTRLTSVTFDNTANNHSGEQNLSADIHAVTINFNSANIVTSEQVVTLNGTTTAANTSLKLESGDTLKFIGNTTSPFTGTTVISTNYDGSDIGHILADGAKTIVDFSGVAAGSKVVLTSSVVGRVTGNKEFTLVNTTNGGAVNLGANFDFSTLPTTNSFVQWEIVNKDKGTFRISDNSVAGAQKILKSAGADADELKFSDLIFGAAAGTDAHAYADELAEIGDSNPAEFKNSLDRNLNQTSTYAGDAINDTIAQVSSATIEARGQTLANPAVLRVTSADGISAGAEDTLRYGAWGSPFYSQGVQKVRKAVSGYKSKTVGGTVGFDTMANDTMIVGLAATVAKTDLKHKNINSGDKTKADTLMFSIYGLQQIGNDWFLQGVANFGSTRVKNTSGRKGSVNGVITMQTATAKYDSMSWGGEVLGGYNLNVTSLGVVTPMLGVEYTRTNDGGYTETGTRNQNQTVSKKSMDRLRVVAGVRAVMATIEQNGFVITPEVHGFVRQALNDKKAKVDAKLNGVNSSLPVKSVKPVKTNYNLGLGLNASSGMMSYGLTYDARLANKFVGHQGSFKVRVNF